MATVNQEAQREGHVPIDGDVVGPSEERPPTRVRAALGRLRRPRAWVPTLVVLVLVAVGAWWLLGRGDAAVEATTIQRVVEVTSASIDETASAEGTVAAAETEDLSFTSSGTITAVHVAAGDSVVAGQVLATIDSAALEADVAEAEAAVAEAGAKLSDDRDAGASDAQIRADESSLTSAQDALDNADEALGGASLVAGFDGTVSAVNITVGEQLSSSGSGGTNMTGSGSGSGRSSSSLGSGSSTLVPGTGASSSTTSSTPQVQLVSTGRFQVELSVDASEVDRIEVGQSAVVAVTTASSSTGGFPGGFGGGGFPGGGGGFPGGGGGLPGGGTRSGGVTDGGGGEAGPATDAGTGATANGTVTSVGRVADASSGVAMYPVTVTFSDDSGDIYVGSSVTATITVSSRPDVVQVASAAVTRNGRTSTVTVAVDGEVDGRTEVRQVTTGESSGTNIEITSGLEPGEQVLVSMTGIAGGMQLPDGFQIPEGFSPGGAAGGRGGANQQVGS